METEKRHLIKQGYHIIRNVLSEDEVQALRDQLFRLVEGLPQEKYYLNTREFLAVPELAAIPFHPTFVREVRRIVGDFTYFQVFDVHYNSHSDAWHKDSQSQLNMEYLYEKDYMVMKCLLHLQENDPEWGGGIVVKPGTHRPTWLGVKSPMSRAHMRGKISALQLRAMAARDEQVKSLPVDSKPGDVILMNMNLLHTARQPTRPMNGIRIAGDIPRDKYKFQFQWEISPNNRFVDVYRRHLWSVGEDKERKFNTQANVTVYPDHYSKTALELISRNGVSISGFTDLQQST